jgi:hypothetical protein
MCVGTTITLSARTVGYSSSSRPFTNALITKGYGRCIVQSILYELTRVGLEAVFERVQYLDSIKGHATRDAIFRSFDSVLRFVSRALIATADRATPRLRKNALKSRWDDELGE